MLWLQDNWWIAAIVAVLAILIVVFLVRRSKAASFDFPEDIAESTPQKAAPPPKPLEPKKPEIIAAEPARFKPLETTPTPAPKPAPVATPAPMAAPAPAPAAAPAVAPVEQAAAEAAPAPVAEPAPAVAAPAPEATPAPAAAPEAAGDNLRLMKGVGPKLVTLLTSLGITRFAEIAAWTEADIDRIDAQLGSFAGRIRRDNWVDQAGYLAKKDKAGFEAKYGALGGEL